MNELSNKMIRLICLTKAVEVLGPNRFRFEETHEVTEPFLEAARRFHKFVSAEEATEAALTLDVDPESARFLKMWEHPVQLHGLRTLDEALRSAPEGFRLPTLEEYNDLRRCSDYEFDKEAKEGAFLLLGVQELRLYAAGQRHANGACTNVERDGYFLSSSIIAGEVSCLHINGEAASIDYFDPRKAFSAIYILEKID